MWILPTYGRPERCQETLDSIIASGVSTSGVVIIDGNEEVEYPQLELPVGWKVYARWNRHGVCENLNAAFAGHPDEPWYGFISDDSIVHTPGWDTKLIEAAGSDGFANSADGFNARNRMHGAVVFGGDLLRALGYWAPPGLVHSFCDDAWERIGRALGNWKYVPSVMVEHKHFMNNKAEKDATYDLAYSTFQQDKAAFEKWLAEDGVEWAVERAAPIVNRSLQEKANNRAQRTSVMICTPVYRDCAWQYTRAMVDTCLVLERGGVYHRAQFVIGNSNLPRARNELVAEFLASDCSTMLFIDSDMGWKPNDVLRLLASEHELVGGVGRKRCDAPNTDQNVWCAWFLDQELEQDELGCIKVGGVGTGFLKIDRSVFEKTARANPKIKRRPLGHMSERVGEQFHDFFRFSDGPNGECIGEDFHFCTTWRNLGGDVWIDPSIKLEHVGEHAFTGTIAEVLVAAEPIEVSNEVGNPDQRHEAVAGE